MAGCVMFDELRRVGLELFADEPEVAARIELLYSDILTDEVGHVGYCASRCTTRERAIMRRSIRTWAASLPVRPRRSACASTAKSYVLDLTDLDVEELTAGLKNETFLATQR
jgi:hypothetical protein